MSTNCLTKVIDEYGTPILGMYRHWDGYPTGHGLELAEFLNKFAVVNGIGVGNPSGLEIANGMSCLAAQIVAEFKHGPGDIYLTTPEDTQEWNYTVYLDKTKSRERSANDEGLLCIKVEDYDGVRFDGTVDEFLATGGKFPPSQWNECEECGAEFKHYNHALNHYRKHHEVDYSSSKVPASV